MENEKQKELDYIAALMKTMPHDDREKLIAYAKESSENKNT